MKKSVDKIILFEYIALIFLIIILSVLLIFNNKSSHGNPDGNKAVVKEGFINSYVESLKDADDFKIDNGGQIRILTSDFVEVDKNLEIWAYEHLIKSNLDSLIVKYFNDKSKRFGEVSNMVKINIIVGIILCCVIGLGFWYIVHYYKKEEKAMRLTLEKDLLTSLYNCKSGEEYIKEYIKTKDENMFGGFIIFDIDYFKYVNDTFGHAVGNEVLVEISNIMRNSFRERDILCRWGGDEFIILMKDISHTKINDIELKIDILSKQVKEDLGRFGRDNKMSLSIGATIFNKDIEFEELFNMTDKLLYEIKNNGKDGYKITVI